MAAIDAAAMTHTDELEFTDVKKRAERTVAVLLKTKPK